jgi:uncharacterized damage-inducible protein DinB
MMIMKRRILLLAGVLLLVLPRAVAAQEDGMQAWQDETVADLEQMRDKFVSLAEAFPEEMWAWEPMEDTPSVRDIMLRILLWGRIAPPRWGAEHIYAPEIHAVAPTLADGTSPDLPRSDPWGPPVPASKAGIIRELDAAMNYMIAAVGNMTPADRAVDATWSDRPTNGAGVVLHAVNDMHEHLGRAIAYARTNQIVPPWSR